MRVPPVPRFRWMLRLSFLRRARHRRGLIGALWRDPPPGLLLGSIINTWGRLAPQHLVVMERVLRVQRHEFTGNRFLRGQCLNAEI